jgi:hypothetical protein
MRTPLTDVLVLVDVVDCPDVLRFVEVKCRIKRIRTPSRAIPLRIVGVRFMK